MNKQIAVNLIDEAKAVFIDSITKLDDDLKKKLSLYDLDRLFDGLAYPAIERVRHIQRFIDEPEKITPPLIGKNIKEVMDELSAEPGRLVTVDKHGNIVK